MAKDQEPPMKRPRQESLVSDSLPTDSQSVEEDSQRGLATAAPSDAAPYEAYAPGQRAVYTPAHGRARLAVVRFAGTVGDRPLVGLELDEPMLIAHDGTEPRSGSRLFRCEDGRGLYVSARSSRLQRIAELAATEQRAQRKLMRSLETMSECDSIRLARRQRATEDSLRLGPEAWSAGSFRKCWDDAAKRYRYLENGTEAPNVWRVSLPRGASVSSVEGGPEAETQAQTETQDQSSDAAPAEAELQPSLLPSLQSGKVSAAEAAAVFERCARNWREPLPASILLGLAHTAQALFLEDHTVLRLATPPNGRLIVVGDTHGHLKDLVHIWKLHGPPSPENVYLINGDICDRGDCDSRGGQQALSIWACVLSFKIANPSCIYMNRGNHEDGAYWPEYGEICFSGEIESKYPRKEADQLIEAFGDLCKCLPVAAVIDDACLVLHGGLPRTWSSKGAITLEDIGRLRRPVAMPDSAATREQQMVYDLAWADPQAERGIGKNERGDDVISFGPDVTARFLSTAGLSMLIRSHEVPGRQERFEGRGFEWWHPLESAQQGCATEVDAASKLRPLAENQEGWCLTVFSASDYCGCAGGNKSSHVVCKGHVRDFSIVEHTGLEAEKSLLECAEEGSKRVPDAPSEQHALAKGELHRALVEKIVECKHQLLAEFTAADTRHEWFLPVEIWERCCCKVLPLIAWEDYVDDPTLVPVRDGRVSYTVFLARYQIAFRNRLGLHAGFRHKLTDHLFESLLRADCTLRETLRLVDKDGDGVVTVEELGDALAHFGRVLTPEQARALYRTTIASRGSIRVEEFLGSLSLHFAFTHARPTEPDNAFVPERLDAICREILDEAGDSCPEARKGIASILRGFFEEADRDANGYVELPELAAALRPMRACAGLTDKQLDIIGRYMDLDGNGRINYAEFLNAMYVRHADKNGARRPGPVELLEDTLEAVHRVLHFEYARPLRALLRRLSAPGCSRITPVRFATALATLNAGAGGHLLNTAQIDCLVQSLDVSIEGSEQDGHFDFEDFFDSFHILDTMAEEES